MLFLYIFPMSISSVKRSKYSYGIMDLFSPFCFFLSRVLFRPCVKCVLRFYKQRENKKYQRTEVNSTPNNGCESVILGDTAGRVALKNLAFPIFACV